MCEYTWICLSGFCFICTHCNPLSSWMYGCLFQRSLQSKGTWDDFFIKRQNLIFSRVAGSIWFVFCLRLNIFQVRFKISEGRGPAAFILICQIALFNRCPINIFLCFKSNWFDLRLKILNLDWGQEFMLIVFWKHYFTWHIHNIMQEIFKFLFSKW